MTKYDIIIIGGGISGLYNAYELLKTTPDASLLLLEASNRVGGRIHTYHDKKYPAIESGAGRFHKNHRRLWKLIHELGLEQKIVPIATTNTYIPQPGTSVPENTGHEYIEKVIKHARREPQKTLQNMTFIEYASTVLPPDSVKAIIDSFGYSLELTTMNTYDTIKLITNHMNEQFYGLKGGLEQIVTGLMRKLATYPHFRCKLGEPVKGIAIHKQLPSEIHRICTTRFSSNPKLQSKYLFEIKTSQQSYDSYQCICTLPKENLEKISLFTSIKPILKYIKNLPLCRIYTRFSVDPQTKEVWFKGMKKFTTNNRLRYVIPIDESRGIIMISYSDGKYANYWNNLRNRPKECNTLLQKQIQDLFPDAKIPMPQDTKIFYWKHGVAYFQPGLNSNKDIKKLREPFPGIPLYICGENYSEENSQWIEGALDE